jgi:hypothetical protein
VSDEAYTLSLAAALRRVLVEGPSRGLPAAVAAAVTEFLTDTLLDDPHRVGTPLARELAGDGWLGASGQIRSLLTMCRDDS